MTCVLNAGFSLTRIGSFPSMRHHVPPPSARCESTYTLDLEVLPVGLTLLYFFAQLECNDAILLSLRQPEEGGIDLKFACLSAKDVEQEVESDAWRLARVDPETLRTRPTVSVADEAPSSPGSTTASTRDVGDRAEVTPARQGLLHSLLGLFRRVVADRPSPRAATSGENTPQASEIPTEGPSKTRSAFHRIAKFNLPR